MIDAPTERGTDGIAAVCVTERLEEVFLFLFGRERGVITEKTGERGILGNDGLNLSDSTARNLERIQR